MWQKYAIRVLLVALCCAAQTKACWQRPPEPQPQPQPVDLQMTPTTTTSAPVTCPTVCYTGQVCEVVAAVTSQAASLRQVLATELEVQRHQFRGLRGSCNVSQSVWDEKRRLFLRAIGEVEKEPGKNACQSLTTQDTFVCTAYIELIECAVSQFQSAHESSTLCVQAWDHGRWGRIFETALGLTTDLDYLYDSILSGRKTNWETIKSSLKELWQRLGSSNIMPVFEIADISIWERLSSLKKSDEGLVPFDPHVRVFGMGARLPPVNSNPTGIDAVIAWLNPFNDSD